MKFLLDHEVPEDLIYLLQELGHDVVRLRDVLPQEASDAAVLHFAHEHRCLFVTCNPTTSSSWRSGSRITA